MSHPALKKKTPRAAASTSKSKGLGKAPLSASLPPDDAVDLAYALPPDDPAYRVFLDSLHYLPPEDVLRVRRAANFADWAHKSQVRFSGEPYITHPLCVAGAIAEWHMDADAICAALLHDVLEDTPSSKEDLARRFGAGVASLVDGLSKLDKIEFASLEEAQAENFRKMLLAMARDLRVVLIKFADRHHNLQTMAAIRPEKRRRIARETLEIYAPIANRLGLNTLFQELQDISLRLIYPMRTRILDKALHAVRGNRQELLRKILERVCEKISEVGVLAQVSGREKSLYSIYTKMQEKHLPFSQVLDIYGFRVVVRDVPSCYLAMGALHMLYKPVPGKFKDYIAIPKANGYQSLHTSLVGPHGLPIEVQIRTEEMHYVAQAGVASHWLYKDISHSGADLRIRTHKWLHSLLEMQSGDSSEFLENVKVDLFPDEVYVFTPKGRILSLPRGATPMDVAYAIHTDVGNHCVAARINNEPASLKAELKSGDIVEIVTDANVRPNPLWLGYAKTGRARSKIRHFLRTVQNKESSLLGERLLDQEFKALGITVGDVPESAWDRLLQSTGNRNKQGIFTDIGLGRRLAAVIVRRLLAEETLTAPHAEPGALMIHGTEGLAIQLAKCCLPIPGDRITGSIMNGQGLIVHAHDCPAVRRLRVNQPQKWIDVEWEPSPEILFETRIDLKVEKVRGVLAKTASVISNAGANIENVIMERRNLDKMFIYMHLNLQVKDRLHLAQIIRTLRRLPEVTRIARAVTGSEL